MIRALVIDDELHAREEMERLLAESGAIEVVGSCSNAVEALKMINGLRPEVVFLDIQMPVINGFELLNMVNQAIMPHVVFVTAYDQFSLKAFEEKTLDYLLKPVDSKRLEKTIVKLQEVIGTKRTHEFSAEPIRRIPCLLGNRIKLISIEEIESVSTGPTGVHLTTNEGEYYTEVTLKVLEERTPLLRCHKQYLINLECIAEIILMEGGLGRIRTNSGNNIPISRRFLKILKKKLLL